MQKRNNTIETWKAIPGHEERYEASSLGRVRNRETLKILKFRVNKGYYLVNLFKQGKPRTYMVHRLIGITFIDNPEDKREINHIDENKKNNSVANLQWATPKENSNHGTRNLRISQSSIGSRGIAVCQINAETNELIKIHRSQSEALKALCTRSGCISECCNGKRQTFKGYRWMRYKDYLKAI